MTRNIKDAHNNKEVLEYWNDNAVESMYDKYLITLEINLIKKHLKKNSVLLDAGCGEGEGTLAYAKIPGIKIDAADFSETRLKKAKKRLAKYKNIRLLNVDFLSEYQLSGNYDFIVSQRFLINLMDWEIQKKILLDLMGLLKKGGILLMLEGSLTGVKELNELRSIFKLDPIKVKWHNLFFEDQKLVKFMESKGFKLKVVEGLGTYFLMTRGLRPFFTRDLNWDSEFNKISSRPETDQVLGFGAKFSRLKLWIFQK